MSGPAVTLAGANTATPSFTAPIQSTPSAIVLRLTVTDNGGLTDTADVTVDVAAGIAPSFADNTGNAQSWTQNQAIAAITVPAATGTPTPAYAAVGALPAGINFNTTTRAISGAPTAVGSGTIRIRATNSVGSDDWTVTYSTVAAATVPDRPTGFAAGTVLYDRVPLTWNDPSDPSITSYQLLRRDTTGGETSVSIHIDNVPAGTSYVDITDVVESNTYRYRIKARNAQGLSLQSAFIDITTPAAPITNIAPDADAGPNQSVAAGVGVSLDGTGSSDSDGTIASYAWVQTVGDTVSLTDAATATPDFTAPSTDSSQTLTFRLTVADNNGDTDTDTVNVVVAAGVAAPVFSDDTGTAQTWTQGQAITPITVPEATGNPAPSYAAVGVLQAGIAFNTTTRAISGTPTATGSGTITIRASNSQGNDDWTVAYSTTAGVPTTSVTVPLTGIGVFTNYIRWSDNQSLGTVFDADGAGQTLTYAELNDASPTGRVGISIIGTDNRFTRAFEMTGRIIFEASDGETLEVMIADADVSEPYGWVPSNALEVAAFVGHIRGLTDQDGTLTLIGAAPAGTAPAFADDAGDAQSWTQNTAIASITVPAATGSPTPAYAAVGTLPAGIAFNATARVISGTPTAVGSGTITIRASNSEGSDDWTVTYATVAGVAVPDAPAEPTTSSLIRFSTTINWVAPENNGAAIDYYQMEWRQGNSGNWTREPNVTGTSDAIFNLDADTEHQARVRAHNSEGFSGWSNPVTFSTAANQNPVVTINQGDADVDGSSTFTLTATVTDPDFDNLTYLWSASPNVGSFDDIDSRNNVYNIPPPLDGSARVVTLELTASDIYGGSGSDTVVLTVRANQAPTVIVNTVGRTVVVGDTVALDATISDPDHATADLTVAWSGVTGIADADQAVASWVVPNQLGQQIVQVRVEDPLGASTSRAITFTVAAPPTSVTVNLPATEYSFGTDDIRWSPLAASLGTIFSATDDEVVLALAQIQYAGTNAGRVLLNMSPNRDLDDAFEATGRLIFEASDGMTLDVMIADADTAEPYQWTPANSADVIAWASHVQGLTDHNATLTLTMDPPPLLLSDWDDTGLEVVSAALLVASGPGTVASNIYADSDRGGSDTPLDGELGLSATETLISRIRRLDATMLVLNDNDNPNSLALNTYFNSGGDGNDLTLYLADLR